MFEEIIKKTRPESEKIDWHDYSAIEKEKQRQGKPSVLVKLVLIMGWGVGRGGRLKFIC